MDNSKKYNFNPYLRRKIEIIDLIVILLFIIVTLIPLLNYNYFKDQMAEFVLTGGIIGLFFISAFVDFLPTFLNPLFGTTIALAVGFNVHLSIFYTLLGSFVGSILGFELGFRLGSKHVAGLFEPSSYFTIEKFIRDYGKWFLIIAALTPLPDIALVFGAFKVKRRDFYLFGLIPRLIGIALLGYLIAYGISFIPF